MRISVSEAAGQLTDLVDIVRRGEDVILTDGEKPLARISPVGSFIANPEERERAIKEIVARARLKGPALGPDAARSQDFLYDEDGLPG